MKVLIIEDKKELVKSMAQYPCQESFPCEIPYIEKDAQEKIIIYDYDCIILDISLPAITTNSLDIYNDIGRGT